jgi:hypothetical protein
MLNVHPILLIENLHVDPQWDDLMLRIDVLNK